jgi:desulfoferrodoxin-like iron-binding protein
MLIKNISIICCFKWPYHSTFSLDIKCHIYSIKILRIQGGSDMRSIKICKCTTCGNIVLLLQDSNNQLTCCGKTMTILEPNKNEGIPEKHVPFLKSKIKDCKLIDTAIYEVQIGQQEHPMLPEHYIN